MLRSSDMTIMAGLGVRPGWQVPLVESRATSRNGERQGEWSLRLLGGFELAHRHETVLVAQRPQRLLALLSLNRGWQARSAVAERLWSEVDAARAGASLRTTLTTLRRCGVGQVVECNRAALRLSAEVRTDVELALDLCRRIQRRELGRASEYAEVSFLTPHLLPTWDDEWLVVEREHYHQLSLQALELLWEQWTAAGDFASAIEASLGILRRDPLCEPALRALVRGYTLKGNVGAALVQVRRYEQLLKSELGAEPSDMMLDIKKELLPARDSR
jgi:DNA-binding SARP family transcriptional activator